jgi:uncharacterized protein YbaP (TraB family)
MIGQLHKLTQRLSFCLLLLCASYTAAFASDGTSTKSLLWEISGKGLKKLSFLYGTLHAICPEEFALPDAVKDRLKRTEQLSLEIDMDDPNFMLELQKGAMMPNGGSLKSFYNEEQYKMISNHFASTMGINISQVDGLKPFILSSMLIPQITECKPESYEQALMTLAKEQGKEVIGVETVQDQFTAFDKLSQQQQALLLLESIEDLQKAREQYREMVQLYLTQDLLGLEQQVKSNYKGDYALFEKAMLIDRNKNWIPVIEKEAKAKPTFFAVGAAHLPGDNGVIALLRKQGYTVKPVLK